jgi:hypothetical protein
MAFIQTQSRKKKIKINVFFPNNIIFGSTPCLFSYNVSGKLQVKNIANNNTKKNFLFVLIAPFLQWFVRAIIQTGCCCSIGRI